MVATQLGVGSAASRCWSCNSALSSTNSTGFCFLPRWRRTLHARRSALISLSLDEGRGFLPDPVIRHRKPVISKFNSQLNSDCNLQSNPVEDTSAVQQACDPLSLDGGLTGSNGAASYQIDGTNDKFRAVPNGPFQQKDVKRELVMLSLPAIGGQAIEPMVQLMETAFIGQLGSLELASAGVSISIFNIISKLFNIPLLSVTTSFVAEDLSRSTLRNSTSEEKLQLPSVSSSLLLAVGIGIFEATALSLASGPLVSLMGISPASSMRALAQRFLILRALGAPAYVVSLALQGVFRGFKDTKTPVLCLGIGNFTAIFLFPFFMYYCQMGVYGAAISSVVSQHIAAFSMIWHLNKRAVLLPPKLRQLEFGGYLKSGGLLIGRTLAVLLTLTLGTSMAARQGPVAMAAHQICLQVWLAVSLLTDALATSAQALIASYISKDDYRTVKDITYFVLKIGFAAGVSLGVILVVSFSPLAPIFTKDAEVLRLVRTGVMFVSASQPINALAFIFDGLHYGVSDFRYVALSMMLVGALSSSFLLYAPIVFGLSGVWSGLALFMGLRMVAGLIRLLEPSGPWWFLHGDKLV